MKILLIDIETFPVLGYVWQVYEADVLRVKEPTSICAFSAKWLNGKQITKALPDYPGYKSGSRNDKELVKDIWALLDEADIVVAHNGERFDVRKINARFTLHRMKPTSPYKVVDTLKEARSVAAFDSNRLNDLSKAFSFGQKIKTGGSDLWFDCLAGDAAAWRRMKKYNAQDVILLEELYKVLLPWMKGHPNVAIGRGPFLCPTCGSANLQARGLAHCVSTSYQRYQCQDCGKWSRDTINVVKRNGKPFVAVA